MSFLIANWKSVLTFILTAALALGLHLLWMAYVVEPRQAAALQAQHDKIYKLVDADRQNTEEKSNAYENQLRDLRDHVASLSKLQPRCARVSPAGAAGGSDVKKPVGSDEGNGISSQWLYDFAARCKASVIQHDGLADWVDGVYTAREQQ